MAERQRVTRGRGREWPIEERQRVANRREAESGQRKREREWLEEKRQKVARGSSQGSSSCPISFNRSEAESEQRKRGRE